MVPDKFNMVDMEGIDLIESQGVEVQGLYEKLVESIAQCRYQCLYNWKFDGIIIPPTYVEMVATDEEVTINGGVSVDVDDIVHIESFVAQPVIEALSVSENGVYVAPDGVDGYSPVAVDIPAPKYEYVYPVYSELSYGFIWASGKFSRYGDKTNMSNLYEVSPGDFVAFPPSVVGNRFRIHFYAGKTLSDFNEYLENSGSGDVYTADINVTGTTDPTVLTQRWFFTIPESGVVYIMTSVSSQSVESILLKINS